MLVLSVVLMVPAAAAVVGFFLDDVAAAVEARHYPGAAAGDRARARRGRRADALGFLGLVVVANLAALVIYLLVPPLAPFVFWLVNGFLLGREYFGLVAMRRLGPEAARGAAAAALLGGSGSRARRWRCRCRCRS